MTSNSSLHLSVLGVLLPVAQLCLIILNLLPLIQIIYYSLGYHAPCLHDLLKRIASFKPYSTFEFIFNKWYVFSY